MSNAPFAGAPDKHSKILTKLAVMAIANPRVGRARIVSAIEYKGDIFAVGHNQMKSHPFQARFGKNKDSIFLHAEINAIHRALRLISPNVLEDCSLYICRVKQNQERSLFISGLSSPCIGCQRAIAEFGIKNVIFSIEGNRYAQL